MWQGLNPRRADLGSHSAILSAITECTLYILLQPRSGGGGGGGDGNEGKDDAAAGGLAMAQAEADVVSEYFLRTLTCFITHEHPPPPTRGGGDGGSSAW